MNMNFPNFVHLELTVDEVLYSCMPTMGRGTSIATVPRNPLLFSARSVLPDVVVTPPEPDQRVSHLGLQFGDELFGGEAPPPYSPRTEPKMPWDPVWPPNTSNNRNRKRELEREQGGQFDEALIDVEEEDKEEIPKKRVCKEGDVVGIDMQPRVGNNNNTSLAVTPPPFCCDLGVSNHHQYYPGRDASRVLGRKISRSIDYPPMAKVYDDMELD